MHSILFHSDTDACSLLAFSAAVSKAKQLFNPSFIGLYAHAAQRTVERMSYRIAGCLENITVLIEELQLVLEV